MSRTAAVVMALILGWMTYQTRQRNEIWSDPIKLWSDSAMKSPGKVRPWMNLAVAEYQAGNYQLARFGFRYVQTKFPQEAQANISAAIYLAGLDRNDGALDRAQSELERIIVKHQEKPFGELLPAYNILASVYIEQGRNQDALGLLDTLITLDDSWMVNASASYNRARALAGLGRCEEAIRAFGWANTLDPNVTAGVCL